MDSESVSTQAPWTVADAKSKLSQILRNAEREGPQRIGKHRTFVIVPEQMWEDQSSSSVSLGNWLVKNMPQGYELETPSRHSDREIPFGSDREIPFESSDPKAE